MHACKGSYIQQLTILALKEKDKNIHKIDNSQHHILISVNTDDTIDRANYIF